MKIKMEIKIDQVGMEIGVGMKKVDKVWMENMGRKLEI